MNGLSQNFLNYPSLIHDVDLFYELDHFEAGAFSAETLVSVGYFFSVGIVALVVLLPSLGTAAGTYAATTEITLS